MDIIDIITAETISVDIIQEPQVQLTVVTGTPGTNGVGVVAGGTTGQVLVKQSNTNYDTQWANPSAAAGVSTVNGATGDVVLTQDNISDGTTAKQYTATEKTKLAGIASGAQVNTVVSVAGKTGVVTLVKADTGLGNVDNTSDTSKPVSTATQTALDNKQPLDSDLTVIAGLTPADNDIIQRKSSSWVNRTVSQFKTDLALTKSDVGLSNVDNTADAAKPVSAAQQTALDGKQPIDSDLTAIAGLTPATNDTIQYKAGAWVNRTPAQLKTDLSLAKADVGLGSVDNTSDTAKPVSTAQQTALDLKAPLASPAFTGTPTGLTKSHVGLGNVDNTADTAKPVSTAQQTALDLKAPLASPAFTGTPTGITKTHVGLGNVDNTADTAKPVSTAQQTALDARMVWADGSTSTNARPTTSSKVIWVGGTTQPVNMTTGDLWVKA